MAAPTSTATVPTERLPFGKLVAWAGAGLSAAANFIILGYVAIYCTDTLGLSPAVVGVLAAGEQPVQRRPGPRRGVHRGPQSGDALGQGPPL